MTPDVELAFIAESGPLEAQAVRLAESVRRFGGRLADATLTVASPRPSRRPAAATLARLAALGCEYVALDVDSGCPSYTTSWRLHAMAALEQRPGPGVLVQLDSDAFFLDEVDLLPGGAPAAARAVDVQGMTTTGPADANFAYWAALGALAGVEVEALPWVTTSVDRVRVRASHNGGFVAARRGLGLFARTDEVFRRGVAADLRPHAGRGLDVRSGTGTIGLTGSEWWGSAQAALSIAATSLGVEVAALDDGVNVPLHLWHHGLVPPAQLRHVHYHWLLEPGCAADGNPLLDGEVELPPAVAAWLRTAVAAPAA